MEKTKLNAYSISLVKICQKTKKLFILKLNFRLSVSSVALW